MKKKSRESLYFASQSKSMSIKINILRFKSEKYTRCRPVLVWLCASLTNQSFEPINPCTILRTLVSEMWIKLEKPKVVGIWITFFPLICYLINIFNTFIPGY